MPYKDPAKYAAYKKAWCEANRGKILAQKRAYYLANRGKISARKHAYYLANREEILENNARKLRIGGFYMGVGGMTRKQRIKLLEDLEKESNNG